MLHPYALQSETLRCKPTQEVLRREEAASTKADAAALLEALERTRADVAAALAGAGAGREAGGGDAAAVSAAVERALAPVQTSLAALQTQARRLPPLASQAPCRPGSGGRFQGWGLCTLARRLSPLASQARMQTRLWR